MKGRRIENKPYTMGTLVTLLIVAMLIFSGPAQAVQIGLNTKDLNDRVVGEIGYFYVNITIGANERIPIDNISVEELPHIPGSPEGKLVLNLNEFDSLDNAVTKGNYKIILIERKGWVGGYGYGYGYENNYGYQPYYGYGYEHSFFGYGYGYGYDYGYGYGYGYESSRSYTRLKFRVEVDTTGAKAGTYRAVAIVNSGKGVVFVGSSSFTLKPDTTPPASVTDLNSTNISWNYINWTWTNPIDADFAKVQVYINGNFKEEVISPGNYYNATGLNSSTLYEISTRTMDASGNVNQTWINHTARTAILPAKVTIKPQSLNLKKTEFKAFIELPAPYNVSNINGSSVVCEGARVKEYKIDNFTFIADFMTVDLVNITSGKEVKFTVTGNLNDGTPFEGSNTINVFSKDNETDVAQSRGGGGKGGSTGGNGVVSSEPLKNIEKYESKKGSIYGGIPSKFTFTSLEFDVFEIIIIGKINEDDVMVRVEKLKGLSPKVKKPAPGTSYLNVLVGSENIQEVLVRFNVANKWIESQDIASSSDLKVYGWDGKSWTELVTTLKNKDYTNSYYEVKINEFSHLAITGPKSAPILDTGTPAELTGTVPDGTTLATTMAPMEVRQPIQLVYIAILVGIIAIAAYLFTATRRNR